MIVYESCSEHFFAWFVYDETTTRKSFTQEDDYREFHLTFKKQNYKHAKLPVKWV